jgi:hypothetical protein
MGRRKAMSSRFLALASAAVVAVGLTFSGIALADGLPAPTDRTLLSVSGDISATNADGAANFDRAMLKNLKVTKLRTSTPWTEGVHEFEGVLASDLMNAVGAKGDVVIATAINDYKVEIPAEDFTKYPVLLAWSMDGEELKIRDKGPVWIVYPQDQFAELQNLETKNKWIWQLKSLQFN